MGLTNYPNGITSFGMPVVGTGGLLTQGKNWFVKPSTGSDGNSGTDPDNSLATLTKALSLATANQNDTIYLFAQNNTGSSTSDVQGSTLTWNKDLVHLVGVAPPTAVSQRARISQTLATAISPMVNVTANSCYFRGVQIIQESSSASSLVNLQVTGQRNVFESCHIAGLANVTQSAPGSCSLKIDGGAENVFRRCVIGLDTIARDADATEILFDTDATRNVFEDCYITSYISAAGFASVTLADVTAIDRYVIFKRCLFMTDSVNKGVTQDQVFSIPTPIAQGKIILMDSYYNTDGATGAGIWTTTGRGNIWNNAVAAAAAGAGGEMTKL